MSIELISESVIAKLKAEYTETVVAYDNNYFSSAQLDSWIRLSMLPGTPYSIGSKCYRENGFIVFGVFIKREQGTIEAYRLADVLSDMFKLQRFNDIVTNLPDVVRVGISKADGAYWFQLNVFIEYHYDTK